MLVFRTQTETNSDVDQYREQLEPIIEEMGIYQEPGGYVNMSCGEVREIRSRRTLDSVITFFGQEKGDEQPPNTPVPITKR